MALEVLGADAEKKDEGKKKKKLDGREEDDEADEQCSMLFDFRRGHPRPRTP